ncbi:fcp1 [Candida oxycetoniae]|uniref:RNA polymerase II subunit A C-terminal domain phosphatase n=1 Tax=Candida oxycetoniae TaxID=497107 RepID=A0AAI9SU11_9ASCO|nr:fcp1 [Candida oxycetoniae]KAI3402880.2 fcp1 [Candida oxycetoniae]
MTAIKLPVSLPFPVIISSILCKQGDSIEKHKEIFNYKYWTYQDDPHSKEEPPKKIRVECIGTFESPIEGEVKKINVRANEEITHSDIDILHIKEACAHTVQYGGLCALCGKSLDEEKDYSGYDYEERATIAMSHDNTDLKISFDEAAKIEHGTTDRLNNEKKLILVVDLDQTVIHATVDPTVGEWQSDPSNPNYPAVKDVKTFCLEEDPVVPAGWTGPKLAPTKCWYYVKVRPGLAEFLEKMDEKYEMHIYTMATRNYALEIAKIIDPDGKYFGDRILSRDESGSLTHKNLKRLFPVDQSMVVIIDDRGDVWQWESNLIKVVPYDFFVGIGDINSSFLPKKSGQLTGPIKKRKSIAKLEAAAESKMNKEKQRQRQRQRQSGEGKECDGEREGEDQGDDEKCEETEETEETEVIGGIGGTGGTEGTEGREGDRDKDEDLEGEGYTADTEAKPDVPANPVDRILELGGGEDNTNLLLAQSLTRNQSIEQQQHDRPLAKLQHDLEQMHEKHSDGSKSVESSDDADDSDEEDNLLYDDDNELIALNKVLQDVHRAYYEIFDKNLDPKPNLTEIIPQMKSKCLAGITILFSGIIPLGVNLDSADIVIWCKQFGVNVVNEVYPEVTHVICKDVSEDCGPTFKARAALKLYGDSIKMVNPDWLFSCLSTWSKVDEKDYLIATSNPKLWAVKESEVDRYKKRLEEARSSFSSSSSSIGGNGENEGQKLGLINSFEDYNLDEANQEVDDFLAGLSEDEEEGDDDDDDDDDEGEDEEGGVGKEGKDEEDGGKEGKDSNGLKTSIVSENDGNMDLEEKDNKEENEETSINNHDSFIKDIYNKKRKVMSNEELDTKKQKTENIPELNDELDDLEQELLDGFNDLED